VQAALHEPFVVDGLSLHVEASLGVVTSARHGRDPERLLRAADVAMYAAKSTSSGIAEYEPELDCSTAGQLALLSDLRRALDVDTELRLHYQPQVGLAFGQLVGVEALLRWVHPRRGLVSPAAFVPAAEGTGLIHPLTTHVLGLALEQLARWRLRGWQHPVAVNLSTRCLLDQSLPDRVLGLLEHHGVPTSMLRLEITESALMADSDRALRVLQTLHEAGIRLSIDDFGTGYSSMSYLKRLPVDELKIDRCFVKDMTVDCGDATLVRTVVEMGHNLGLQVVAEGIEDEATLLALAEIGCGIAQGFHIASPMPAAEFDAWQTRRRGAVAAGRRRRAVAARP
jgi:EAL domain-containing protein (putative c-di-GMP-specific phosphodiesterase class I)